MTHSFKNIMHTLKSTFLFTLLFCSFSLVGLAQTSDIKYEVSQSQAVLLGKTKPVYDLALTGQLTNEKRNKWKKDRKRPADFKGRRGESKAINPLLEHRGEDALWQKSIDAQRSNPTEPIVNIDGLQSNFGSPHDPSGDIGQNYYIQGINSTRIGVFDKEGNIVTAFNASTLWASLGAGSLGDPIILYDQQAKRWMISEFTGPTDFLIAISETEDPLGSYYTYRLSAPNFPDYPKYGIWTDHYVITTNEQGGGTLHQYFLDRAALLAGEETVTMQRVAIQGNSTEAGFYTSTPVDWNGDILPSEARPIVLALSDSSWSSTSNQEDALRFVRFDIDFSNPNNTIVDEIQIPLSPFDSYPCAAEGFGFSCIPQPNGNGLDGLPELVMNAPYYRGFEDYESIVLNFVTDLTDGDDLAGIRWVELRKTAELDWHLYQEGTLGLDDGLHRFMGGIATDKDGNIGLAYSVSSNEEFAGIRYTGRRANDQLGIMTIPETEVVKGLSTINSGGRFGDYSHMTVDPTNNNTFWFTSEYAGSNDAATRIFAFELRRDTFDLGVKDIRQPITGDMLTDSETIVVEYVNAGVSAIETFDIAVSVNGEILEETTINQTLESGDTYLHTFATSADLSAFGEYEILSTVSEPMDQNPSNNTLTKMISHLATNDVGISAEFDALLCPGSQNLTVEIFNNGFENLNQVDISVNVNGTEVVNETYTLDLATGESAINPIEVDGIVAGQNTVVVTASNPNGNMDPRQEDNIVTLMPEQAEGAVSVVFELVTDEYPDETTWELFDPTTFSTVASGGPYNLEFNTYREELCLSKDVCYIFRIFDSYGDGICCAFGEGSYGFYDTDGNVLLYSLGEFGGSDEVIFCPNVVDCDLTATVVTENDFGAGDGSIMISASNGQEPYMYSIDGGQTFQDSPLFTNVSAGSYDVFVADASDVCTYEEVVEVMLTSSTDDVETAEAVIISPNPSNGVFTIELTVPQIQGFNLNIDILDASGRIIQSRSFGKYDGTFKGAISLTDYPQGNYYFFVNTQNFEYLAKLIKI